MTTPDMWNNIEGEGFPIEITTHRGEGLFDAKVTKYMMHMVNEDRTDSLLPSGGCDYLDIGDTQPEVIRASNLV